MENFSKGFVIGTFASPAYVDMQLALHIGKWKHDCIVVDDGSCDYRLAKVCDKWEVPLFGWDCPRQGHQNGDACVFYCGLNYFKDSDFVFKISRRFVWKKDFSLKLPDSDYYKSPLLTDWWVPDKSFQDNNSIATCCTGLFNPAIDQQRLDKIQNLSDTVSRTSFMQRAMRDLFRDFQNPVTVWRDVYKRRGYQEVGEDIIWYKKTVNWPYAYKKFSDQLGLHWSLQDFWV